MENLDQLLAQTESLLVISLLVSVAFAVACGLIAAHRRARWIYWTVMGFVFGPFALPFVFFAKRKSPSPDNS